MSKICDVEERREKKKRSERVEEIINQRIALTSTQLPDYLGTLHVRR